MCISLESNGPLRGDTTKVRDWIPTRLPSCPSVGTPDPSSAITEAESLPDVGLLEAESECEEPSGSPSGSDFVLHDNERTTSSSSTTVTSTMFGHGPPARVKGQGAANTRVQAHCIHHHHPHVVHLIKKRHYLGLNEKNVRAAVLP